MRLGWHIGDVVRKLRGDLGWGQSTLAQRAQLHVTTIGRLENHGTYEPSTVEKVAAAFTLRVVDLHAAIPESQAELPDDLYVRLLTPVPAKRVAARGGA